MSLENQIRRMGEARAGEADVPSWRTGSAAGRGRWLIAAAAAAVLIAGAAFVWSAGGDDPDVDTADADVDETPPSLAATTAPPTAEAPPSPGQSPTSEPQLADNCSTNPEPSAAWLDMATHISPNRTPLDLDLDGISDEILAHESPAGTWSLMARLATGWTNTLDMGQLRLPALAMTPDSVPAGTDLDADGGLEFFVAGYPAGIARLVSLVGCDLRYDFDVEPPSDRTQSTVDLLLDASALSECDNTCFTRVTCVGNQVIQELFSDLESDPAAPRWGWTASHATLANGTAEIVNKPFRDGPMSAIPADAPSPATTGFVDCSP